MDIHYDKRISKMSSEQDYVEETGLPEEENYNTADNNDSNISDRRGHVCCGKLMDTRKGVLAVDTINIFGILFSLLLNSVIYHERSFGGVLAGLLGTLLSVIGVFGALKFDIRASGIATLGFSFCLLMDMIGLHLIGVIIDIILIYPHAYFSYEVYRGVMTKETYKKEEYLMEGIPKFPDV